MCELRPLAASLLALTVVVGAAEPDAGGSARPPWVVQGLVTGDHAAKADLEDHPGQLGVDALTYEARLFWNPARGTRVGLGLGGGFWDYDGSQFADEPVLRAHRVRLAGLQMVTPHWGVILQEAVGVAYDGRTTMREGLTTTTFVGPLWRRDEDLYLAVGVYLTTAADYVKTIPMISAWWRINERWSLQVFDQVDNLSRLTWRADGRFSTGLRLDVQRIQFALERSVAGNAGGFSDTHAAIGLEADWRPFTSETLVIRPHAGWVLTRQVAFTDRDGNDLVSDAARSAPTAGLTILSAF
jgi:hypothetical protein